MITKTEVKYIQSLAHKKFRDEEKTLVAEGVKMVDELLSNFPDQIKKIYATAEWLKDGRKIPKGISCIEVEQYELDKLTFLKQANQVLALVHLPALKIHSPIGALLILDQIQDPGNLGTLIRTCDWFGISGIVCSPDTADAFSPKVVQSTMGSIFRIPVLYTDLVPYLEKMKDMPVFGATLDGDSMGNIAFSKPCCLVIGNESKGISSPVLAAVSQRVSIPRRGGAESLNAAVAAAILLSKISS
jgi:TrmH family RNA methyltransferase